MSALAATPTKDARVRRRMADDCKRTSDLMFSELESYKGEFWPGELQTIKEVIRDLRRLADRIESNDAANPKTVA